MERTRARGRLSRNGRARLWLGGCGVLGWCAGLVWCGVVMVGGDGGWVMVDGSGVGVDGSGVDGSGVWLVCGVGVCCLMGGGMSCVVCCVVWW